MRKGDGNRREERGCVAMPGSSITSGSPAVLSRRQKDGRTFSAPSSEEFDSDQGKLRPPLRFSK